MPNNQPTDFFGRNLKSDPLELPLIQSAPHPLHLTLIAQADAKRLLENSACQLKEGSHVADSRLFALLFLQAPYVVNEDYFAV